MSTSRSELKTRARCALTGNYGTIICAALLSQILSLVISSFFEQNSSNNLAVFIAIASSVILSLLSGILDAGFHFMYLKIARRQKIKVSDMFHFFRVYPDKVLILSLAMIIIQLLAALPFVGAILFLLQPHMKNVLGILIQFIAGSPVFSIWDAGLFLHETQLAVETLMIVTVLLLGWIFVMFNVYMRFALVLYLFADDPQEDPVRILIKSNELMKGNKLRLFTLLFSFLGIILLGFLSLGVGFLWIFPYIDTTEAFFYLDVVKCDQEHPGVLDTAPTMS